MPSPAAEPSVSADPFCGATPCNAPTRERAAAAVVTAGGSGEWLPTARRGDPRWPRSSSARPASGAENANLYYEITSRIIGGLEAGRLP